MGVHLLLATLRFLGILFSLLIGYGSLFAADPIALYVTWQRDPTTTGVIQWITSKSDFQDSFFYREGESSTWKESKARLIALPQNLSYHFYRIELQELIPSHSYQFKIGGEPKIYRFSTLSNELKEPMRIVIGGDLYQSSEKLFQKTCHQAAQSDPHFALFGGDLAYAGSKFSFCSEDGERWIKWLSLYSKEMINARNELIPLVCAIGNHDLNGRYDQTPKQAAFFYTLFPHWENRPYWTLDIGNFLSFFILDSGHTAPIEGNQTRWLSQVLQEKRGLNYRFAIYHVPAYPSVRRFQTPYSRKIRHHWSPLFEKYGVQAAFEHHDHAYKRTHPLLRDRVDPAGVVYLGDGGWGVDHPRRPKTPQERPYLAKTAASRYFFLLTLKPTHCLCQAWTPNGELLDECSFKL